MPLLYLSVSLVAGIFAASLWRFPAQASLYVLVTILLFLITSFWVPAVRLLALIILAFGLGMWRYGSVGERDVDGFFLSAVAESRVIAIRGVVDAPPEMREMRQNIRLAVRSVRKETGWEEAEGTLLVYAGLAPVHEYGDSIELEGRLENPPEFEVFNYRAYLSGQGIQHVMQRPAIKTLHRPMGPDPLLWINRLRARLYEALGSTLPEPEASLAQGVLLGVRSSMPRALLDSFAATGTTHILAISGYNITVIAALLIAALSRVVGRNRTAPLAALAIGFYAIMAGASPSVLRATVMGVLVIVAYQLGRQSHALNGLAVSAAVLVAFRPEWLWDLGFQLSFLATAGLIFLHHPLSTSLVALAGRTGFIANPVAGKAAGFTIDGLSVSLAATVYTLPLIAFSFHNVPVIAPAANILAVPALPPIIAGSAATAIIGAISLPVAQIVAYLSWPFMSYLVGVVNLFAAIPFSSIPFPPVHPAGIWAYYAALGLFTVAVHLGRKGLADLWLGFHDCWTAVSLRLHGALIGPQFKWVAGPALLIAITAWTSVFSLPDDKLHVTFLDVGQGDAILIRTPDNRKLLIDGGPSPQRLLNQLGKTIPFWDRTIDVVMLTHADDDHLAGLLGAIDRYDVRLVLEGPQGGQNLTYRSWEDAIGRKGVQREILSPSHRIKLGRLDMDVISVPKPQSMKAGRNESLVVRLVMDDLSFLFAGDTPGDQIDLLAHEDDLRSNVLMVPHHGARTGLDERFLKAVDPQMAIISVGAENSFGHPAPETISLLAGTRLFRTDQSGSIEVITDGKRAWVRSWR